MSTTPEEHADSVPSPDVDEFDISAWLGTGDAGRSTETVTVYQDPSMLEEARRLHREAARINEQVEAHGEDLAVGEASEVTRVQERIDDLEARIRATKAEVVIRAVSDGEMEDLAATFRQRYPGEKKAFHESVKGTCLVLAHAATFAGRKLSAEQWRQISEGPLAGGQWDRIKQAYVLAQKRAPRVDNPFSPGS